MRRILFAAVAVFAVTAAAQAQDTKFGIKAGVNFAGFSGDDSENTTMKTGFHIGGVAEIKISEKFSFQPELLYSAQGAEAESSETLSIGGSTATQNTEVTQKLGYLNIPLLAKYYFTSGFSVEAGPQIGFLLNAEEDKTQTTIISGSSETVSGTLDNKERFEGVDFGLAAGLAYDLPMGLFFQARYSFGLTNILKEVTFEGQTVEGDTKNKNIQISVGYKF